jgi:hypothetical protein
MEGISPFDRTTRHTDRLPPSVYQALLFDQTIERGGTGCRHRDGSVAPLTKGAVSTMDQFRSLRLALPRN